MLEQRGHQDNVSKMGTVKVLLKEILENTDVSRIGTKLNLEDIKDDIKDMLDTLQEDIMTEIRRKRPQG